MNNNLNNMLKSGNLYKLGEGPINFDWNLRYFVLDGTHSFTIPYRYRKQLAIDVFYFRLGSEAPCYHKFGRFFGFEHYCHPRKRTLLFHPDGPTHWQNLLLVQQLRRRVKRMEGSNHQCKQKTQNQNGISEFQI